MHDDPDAGTSNASPDSDEVEDDSPSWVDAAGVSGEHVIGDERAPRSHRILMIFGPVGLALAIVASLWSMSQHVERSVNVQVETQWQVGEQLSIRTQVVGGDLKALVDVADVSASLHDGAGSIHELGSLTLVADGLAQGPITVPDLEAGAGELVLRYGLAPGSRVEAFEEHVPIEVVSERGADEGRQVVSESTLR